MQVLQILATAPSFPDVKVNRFLRKVSKQFVFVVVVRDMYQHQTKGDTAALELSGLGAEEERREEHD
ncbi:hypothetical protein Y1Q_0001343 [Alligator mississippiensis]|uniref:Uncharacterized protein n=1 Tax=Alligator mississippiensis TaxID=8496 RepID=A0A151M926_ALLMI|nr:hypothetical protein Y1Q_0001343 [Alligator mississippiensis]